jgi:cation diffusion facilitator CzcD-associated flavoprotein CzcO
MSSIDVDVLIVGAGLSGIGAAVHLQRECPDRSYAILESRDAIGGTWDLFRYPGIRSDSDMYTLGYSFRPWTSRDSIAAGPDILEYIRSTARDYEVERQIRFGHRVERAEWSSEEACWNVDARLTATGELVRLKAGYVLSCGGYYDYEQGYTPEFPGAETFGGDVVHPQKWTDEVDYEGKRIVVIGSGATAVTLVPALAEKAAHVTMLQRSPTYVLSMPGRDPIASFLNRRLPEKAAYKLIRWKNVLITSAFYRLSRKRPKLVRRLLRSANRRQLPDGPDVDVHFNPRYDPWDQRVCAVPDADLFEVLRDGSASIVTERIERFDETGVLLCSGEHLDADMIVTATGLNMRLLGGVELAVDGERVDLSERLVYRGVLLSDVPNMALVMGYTNASWTLKADLTCEFVCRLLNHMEAHGYDVCTPVNDDPSIETVPVIDLSSGYVTRALDQLPKQGTEAPWRLHQNYFRDIVLLRRTELEDGTLRFSRSGARAAGVTAGDPGEPEPLPA